MALGVTLVLLVLGLLPNPWSVLICPFIAGFLSLPCAALGLLATSWVRNINQFQTVYSFLIAPVYFLSGVFFPLQGQSTLAVLEEFPPLFEVLWHTVALLNFTLVVGFLAFRRVGRKLTV